MTWVERFKHWRPPRRWIVWGGRLTAGVAAALGVTLCGFLTMRWWLPDPTTVAGWNAQLEFLQRLRPVITKVALWEFVIRMLGMHFAIVSPRFSLREKVFWVPAVVLIGSLAAAPLFWIWAGRRERGELAGGRPEPIEATERSGEDGPR